MSTPADPQQVSFANQGGKVAIQAGQYIVHGNPTVQISHGQDPLERLPYAAEAPFNSTAKQHESTCLPDTRVDLLQLIYNWADGQDERCIFWLNGLAGTGKSTIARTVARRYYKNKRLGASFFFSRGGGDVGYAGMFCTTVAVQLANHVPTLHRHICDAVTEHGNIASLFFRDQWRQLVLQPLSKLSGGSCPSSYVVVIDALDECDNDNDIRVILHLLAEARSLKTVRLRVFLTSRPETPVRYGFYQIPNAEHQDYVLHNISRSVIDHDISIFLEYNIKLIGQERSLDSSWPGEEVIRYLVQTASGLFVWAATVCRYIREGKRFAVKRLDTILKASGSAVTEPEKHLDQIYTTVLKHSVSSEYTDEEKEELYCMLRQILGNIVVLFSPLSVYSLSRLLYVAKEDINQTLEDLHSVLDVPEDPTRPLRLHHPSFRDFLLNNDRCKDSNFWVDEKQSHQTLAESCIRLMSAYLKQDICGLDAPGVLIAEVESSRVEQCLPLEVQYACLYWVDHLKKGGAQLQDDDKVQRFLQTHFLHWLEALSWMQRMSEGILAISCLESIALACECSRLYTFIHDMKRFALYGRLVIEQAPLQTYCSALIFAPAKSTVRMQFEEKIPRWMRRLPQVQEHWSALLQILEGHTEVVRSVAFSGDGVLLASASDDRTVRLWDAATGSALQTLEGHSSSTNSVTFTPDGKRLASASADKTVRLWDAESGAALQTLKGHSSFVSAVTFSPDGKRLASVSGDGTVRLWDAESGAALQTLEVHGNWIKSVAFSPDGKRLASAVGDGTVRLWGAETGAALQTLEGHSSSTNSVTFTPDGKRLASASADKTVRLWDAESGAALQTLKGHSSFVYTVAFSPDGKRLASVSRDGTVRLWDGESGAALQTLEGYGNWVHAVIFSPNGKRLASAVGDGTVRLWDAETGAVLQTLEGHSSSTNSVTFTPDGKRLASASEDKTVRLWDAESGAALQTLKNYSSVDAIAFSPVSKRLVSASEDKTVRLWDAESGAALQTLKGHSSYVYAVAFSPDSRRLASASADETVRLWDAESGAALRTLKGHCVTVGTVAFSPDGKRLASGSFDGMVRLWDADSGAALQALESHDSSVVAVAFSPDGKWLASIWGDYTVKIWDVESGTAIQSIASAAVIDQVSFSDDGFHHRARPPITILRIREQPNLFVSREWVMLGLQKLLWLPPERRATCVAVEGQTVVLGHKSGRVSYFSFDIELLNSLKVCSR